MLLCLLYPVTAALCCWAPTWTCLGSVFWQIGPWPHPLWEKEESQLVLKPELAADMCQCKEYRSTLLGSITFMIQSPVWPLTSGDFFWHNSEFTLLCVYTGVWISLSSQRWLVTLLMALPRYVATSTQHINTDWVCFALECRRKTWCSLVFQNSSQALLMSLTMAVIDCPSAACFRGITCSKRNFQRQCVRVW